MQSDHRSWSQACRARRLGSAALLLVAALGTHPALAQDPELRKVSSHLRRARSLAAEGESAARLAAAVPSVRMRDGRALVQIRLHSMTPATLEAIRAAGLKIDESSFKHAIASGSVDLARLDELARVAEVSTIHPAPRVGRRTSGSAVDQADITINADDARNDLMVTGSGVTVGILSDSFNKTTLGGTVSGGGCDCSSPESTCATTVTGMNNQNSADLPPSIPILEDCTNPTYCGAPSDEGAAMGEAILDLAPGANLMFHSAFNGEIDFQAGITELVNCGADVLVDDVFWTLQPFFQDGIIAQAAQAAVDAGVAYFSAAGNDATYGINDVYKDWNPNSDHVPSPSPNGNDLHDFGGGDRFAAVRIPDDCDLYAELQWSEPFSGGGSAGASSDLNLYLLSSASPPTSETPLVGNTLDAGVDDQGCGNAGPPSGDPVEFVEHFNTSGVNETVYLAVEHVCGDKNVEMRVVSLSFDCGLTMDDDDSDLATGYDFENGIDFVSGLPTPDGGETPIFVDSQIFGHPAAAGVAAVAASFFREIDLLGALDPPVGQIDVEPFSSLGGDLPFYFDSSGGALPTPPQTRFKPEISAPDGTNTTFFETDILDSFEPPGDTDPNFFGTSASAPHAAAIAALMQEAGNLSPSGIVQILQQGARDLEASGTDNLSGYGLIDGLDSVGTSVPPGHLADPSDCYIDDLEIHGKPNAAANPGTINSYLRACDSLTVGNGSFDGVAGSADLLIFTDGFESGNTSAWGH